MKKNDREVALLMGAISVKKKTQSERDMAQSSRDLQMRLKIQEALNLKEA